MKIVAIDYGEKKIGIATGNFSFGIAFPKLCLKSKEELFLFLKNQNFNIIILGNPLVNLEEEKSKQQVECEVLFGELKERFSNSKNIFLDERMTTTIAKQKMLEIGLSQKKGKDYEDSLAAQILLENYFNLTQ